MAQLTQPNPAAQPWRLALLGETVELTGPGTLWHPPPTAALVLAYLALEGPTPRERMAGLLWPERPEPRARANLRQLLLRIRAVAPILGGASLSLAPDVWVDARDLPDGALAGHAGARLLAGLSPSKLPALADWLAARQHDHAARLRRVLQGRIAAAREAHDLAAAAAGAEQLARLDPWSENACRTVMELALAQAEPAAALRAFRRLRQELAREVGTQPGPETVALARRAARAAGSVRREAPRAHWRSLRLAHSAESGGWLREGAELLLQMADGLADGPELARVLTELAWLEHRLGWNRRAREHARRTLALAAQERGEAAAVGAEADACFVLGSLAWARGDPAAARDHWNQALRALHQNDSGARLRLSLDLALVEDALDRPAAARGHYAAALKLARSMHERAAEAKVLNNLGAQLVHEGRARDGLSLLRRAHAIALERHDRLLEGYVLDSIARAHLAVGQAGDPANARAAAAGAAAIAMDTGDVRLQIESLLTLSSASLASGEPRAARRFATAALARSEASGWRPLVAAARELLAQAGAEGGGRDAGDERDAGVTAIDAG